VSERTLIIQDVHQEFKRVEKIISSEEPDKIIILGDHFDSHSWDENVESPKDTAEWLAESLEKQNRLHLIGNHDVSYITSNRNLRCNGYDKSSQVDIDSVMRGNWGKMHLYLWLDDWLCTHAGLHPRLYQDHNSGEDVKSFMEKNGDDAMKALLSGREHFFFQIGWSRGGESPYGGIVWCDYKDEYKDFPNINQIFGHTPLEKPVYKRNSRLNSAHLALDTYSGDHYALYSRGEFKIKEIKL
jgi:Calcineurin-like phosphoesterase